MPAFSPIFFGWFSPLSLLSPLSLSLLPPGAGSAPHRRITSIALATRVSKLESEAARLRQHLAEKDDLVAELRAKVETLDSSLADVSDRLTRANEEKVRLPLSLSFLSLLSPLSLLPPGVGSAPRRWITSIALATRVSKLESEAACLRQHLAEKDDLVAELRTKVETLDASLTDVSDRLACADEEKVRLPLSLSLSSLSSPLSLSSLPVSVRLPAAGSPPSLSPPASPSSSPKPPASASTSPRRMTSSPSSALRSRPSTPLSPTSPTASPVPTRKWFGSLSLSLSSPSSPLSLTLLPLGALVQPLEGCHCPSKFTKGYALFCCDGLAPAGRAGTTGGNTGSKALICI